MAFNPLNQKGQSSIEAAVIMVTLSTFISVFLGTLYLLYASYWVQHIMYESLICQEERGSTQYCISKAQSKLKSILFFDQAFTVHMTVGEYESRIKVQMKIDPPFFDSRNFTFSKVMRI